MADFDDITGWKQDLEALRHSKEYLEQVPRIEDGKLAPQKIWPSADLNTSQMVIFMRAVLKHEELTDAFRQVGQWYADNPFNQEAFDLTGNGRPNRTPWPEPAARDADDFVSYFQMKLLPGTNPDSAAGIMKCAGDFLIEHQPGGPDDLDVPAFKAFMQRFPHDFDFSDLEGEA